MGQGIHALRRASVGLLGRGSLNNFMRYVSSPSVSAHTQAAFIIASFGLLLSVVYGLRSVVRMP
ncbi:MAG: hypothetical protein OHK0023_08960 [Anaerolineae bacterium]